MSTPSPLIAVGTTDKSFFGESLITGAGQISFDDKGHAFVAMPLAAQCLTHPLLFVADADIERVKDHITKTLPRPDGTHYDPGEPVRIVSAQAAGQVFIAPDNLRVAFTNEGIAVAGESTATQLKAVLDTQFSDVAIEPLAAQQHEDEATDEDYENADEVAAEAPVVATVEHSEADEVPDTSKTKRGRKSAPKTEVLDEVAAEAPVVATAETGEQDDVPTRIEL